MEKPVSLLSQQPSRIAERGLRLAEKWGGRLPTWQEFQEIYQRGAVDVDLDLANRAMGLPGVPRSALLLYNGLLVYAALALLVGPAIGWWFFGWNGWWIPGGLMLGVILGRFAQRGRGKTILKAAQRNAMLYQQLIGTGVFDFDPK